MQRFPLIRSVSLGLAASMTRNMPSVTVSRKVTPPEHTHGSITISNDPKRQTSNSFSNQLRSVR